MVAKRSGTTKLINTINATILILGILKQFNLIYSCKISISQFSVPLQLLVSSPQS